MLKKDLDKILAQESESMTFRQTIEKVLNILYKPYDTSLGIGPDPEWNRIYDYYEKRYLNPDSPQKRS